MATRGIINESPERPVTTGYLYSGMAIAGIHAVSFPCAYDSRANR